MIYTPLTERAMKIAYYYHNGQRDKGNIPYIFHPIIIAEQMNDVVSVCVALLHDVLEDTEYSEIQLRQDFPEEIANLVILLTKKKHQSYEEYIEEIAKDPIATKIKIADLQHNSIISRLPEITIKDTVRIEKYRRCIEYLSNHREDN